MVLEDLLYNQFGGRLDLELTYPLHDHLRGQLWGQLDDRVWDLLHGQLLCRRQNAEQHSQRLTRK